MRYNVPALLFAAFVSQIAMADGGDRSYFSYNFTDHFSSSVRDSDGLIHRSTAAKNQFKRQLPCPSTGRRWSMSGLYHRPHSATQAERC